MISETVEFRGFDVERHHNLARLFGVVRGRGPKGPPGLLLLLRGERLLLAHHTRRGALEADEVGPGSLEERANRLGARWALAADLEGVEAIHEAVAGQLRVGQDVTELVLLALRAADEEKARGRLELFPDLFEGVRPPSRAAVDRVFDVVFPPRSSILFYVFDGSRLHAEVLCARGPREIGLIGGHSLLEAGEPPTRWRESYRELLQAAERTIGAPSLGVFVSLEAARALLGGDPGADLSKALGHKELIIDPLPLWLAGPLGLAAVRNAVEVGRKAGERLVERMRPTGLAGRLAGQVAGRVAERVKTAVGDRLREHLPLERVEQTMDSLRKRADLGEILGFDPFLLGRRFAELLRGAPTDR